MQLKIYDPLENNQERSKTLAKLCNFTFHLVLIFVKGMNHSVLKYISHFCHVSWRKTSPELLSWKQYLVTPEWVFRVSPVSTHSGSASPVGCIHLYVAPRDGHSTVTFLRSCRRLQAIALAIPNPVNHVIFGCYSRTHHSALQFGPVWRLSFLMLFGFMFSIRQKIPFR